LKPIDNYEEMAKQLWLWNSEHGDMGGYPYSRLIEVTKVELRELARRLAPFAVPVGDEPMQDDGWPVPDEEK
jgi:hypothetical protein